MNIGRPPFEFVPHLIYLIAFLFPWCCRTLRSQAMVLRRTYASLDILGGDPPQHTQAALFPYPGPVDQSNPLSVSPAEVPVPPHSAHYDRSQLSQIRVTTLFRTPVASPISRQTSPLGPHQSSLPDRPIFPCSKSDPSFYRKAQIQRFRRSSRGREFFRRKKISASITDAITKPKNG
jgi:hypothetical protein